MENASAIRARNIATIKRDVDSMKKDVLDMKALLHEIRGSMNLLRIRLDAHESKTDPIQEEEVSTGWFW